MLALLRSVYDKRGHIITNNQVVGAAKVIGSDTYNDIALIQISQNASKPSHLLSSLRALVLGNSSKMDVGDVVITIGNLFGLSDTMTTAE